MYGTVPSIVNLMLEEIMQINNSWLIVRKLNLWLVAKDLFYCHIGLCVVIGWTGCGVISVQWLAGANEVEYVYFSSSSQGSITLQGVDIENGGLLAKPKAGESIIPYW